MKREAFKNRRSIFLTAGGTGGHVIPALALMDKLESEGFSVCLLTDPRGRQYVPEEYSGKTVVLPLPRYRGSILAGLRFVTILFRTIFQVVVQMIRTRPVAVVGFGGYVTLPTLLAAVLLRCPVILHEQNALLGRVNRVFGRFARKIAISFPLMGKIPASIESRIVLTGLPVRAEFANIRKRLLPVPFENENKFNILVTGGSQAAQFFAEFIPNMLALLPENLQKQIVVRHQCSAEVFEALRETYGKLGMQATLAVFFKDMPRELEWADLVFARAGASTIAEISIAGKAAFFVPLPHAMDDHQTLNARSVTDMGAGWWSSQKKIEPPRMARFLKYVMEQPQGLLYASEAVRRFGSPAATALLVHEIRSLFYDDENN